MRRPNALQRPGTNRGRLVLTALLGSGLVGATIAACSDSTSGDIAAVDGGEVDAAQDATEDGADAGDAAPSCTLPGIYGSKACMRCIGTNCCDRVTACESDAPCKQLQKCSLDCLPKPDASGCYRSCLAATPGAVPLWDPVEKCWFGTPPAGCLVECT
jgi:hypothetical protein